MTLATILLNLWKLRLWLAVGVVLAVAAAVGSVHECGLIAVAAAGFQYNIVKKMALGIRVQFSA